MACGIGGIRCPRNRNPSPIPLHHGFDRKLFVLHVYSDKPNSK